MSNLGQLKILAEAYRNIAQAPTQTNTKGTILDDLETMITEEITNIRYPARTVSDNVADDHIPF